MSSSKPLLLSPSTSLLNLQSTSSNQQVVPRRRKPNITRSTSSSISSNLSTSDRFSLTSSTTDTHLTQPPHSADYHHSNPTSTINPSFPKSIKHQSINSLLHHLILPKFEHRHTTHLNHILSLFNSLTQSPVTTTSPTNLQHRNSHSNQIKSNSNTSNQKPSINLESDGWTYLGTRQEVRLYTRELTTTEQYILSQHPQSTENEFTIQQSNPLPYFRGEGYLNGKWNSLDLAATLSSIPVRSICDSKLDLNHSSVYQILDSNQFGDQLLKLSFKFQFPIGFKNQSVVQAFRPFSNHQSHSSFHQVHDHDDIYLDLDHEVDSGGVWVSTSVVDNLMPESEPNSRSWLSLCGFSFRPTSSRPPTYSNQSQQSQPNPLITSPESNTSPTRIPTYDRTSPIQPLSYHHSNQINLSNQSRIKSPSQFNSSGDLPSIVKRLSLTISPVHNHQFNSNSLSNPTILSKSLPSNNHNISKQRRSSKNLSQIDWTNSIEPTIPKHSINLNISPLHPKRNSLIGFSSSINSPMNSPTSNANLRRNRASSILSTSSPIHYSPNQRIRSGPSSTTYNKQEEEEEEEKEDVEGTHVSVVMKVSHGQKVPLSLVHQVLSADVPNLIMNLNRYLTRYGFAPHLSRRNQPKGIKIISEEFNPRISLYKILFKSNEPLTSLISIRFHGLTFTNRYEIQVLRSKKWKVLFDKTKTHQDLNLERDKEEWKGAGTVLIMCSNDGLPVEVLIRKIDTDLNQNQIEIDNNRVLFGFGKVLSSNWIENGNENVNRK